MGYSAEEEGAGSLIGLVVISQGQGKSLMMVVPTTKTPLPIPNSACLLIGLT